VGEYLIAYAPDERPLWVVAVLHGRSSAHIVAAILHGWQKHTGSADVLMIKCGVFSSY